MPNLVNNLTPEEHLVKRISELEEAKKKLSSQSPVDSEEKLRQQNLLNNINKMEKTCREELRIRQNYKLNKIAINNAKNNINSTEKRIQEQQNNHNELKKYFAKKYPDSLSSEGNYILIDKLPPNEQNKYYESKLKRDKLNKELLNAKNNLSKFNENKDYLNDEYKILRVLYPELYGSNEVANPCIPCLNKQIVQFENDNNFKNVISNFEIDGQSDSKYKSKVLKDLRKIYDKPSGKLLLESINKTGKKVIIQHPGIDPSTNKNRGNFATTKPSQSMSISNGTNVDYGVGYNPYKNSLNNGQAWAEPPNRPPEVGLYHELVHINDYSHNTLDRKKERHADGTLPTPKSAHKGLVPNCELRAVGLPPFENESFSENVFRKESGLLKRPNY